MPTIESLTERVEPASPETTGAEMFARFEADADLMCIPVVDGDMVIGEWQSVLMIDLDGPRSRTVGVQLMGYE